MVPPASPAVSTPRASARLLHLFRAPLQALLPAFPEQAVSDAFSVCATSGDAFCFSKAQSDALAKYKRRADLDCWEWQAQLSRAGNAHATVLGLCDNMSRT